MKKLKKLTLRTETIRTLDLRQVAGANVGNTGNTVTVPQTLLHTCTCPIEGSAGIPCWPSFGCYSVEAC